MPLWSIQSQTATIKWKASFPNSFTVIKNMKDDFGSIKYCFCASKNVCSSFSGQFNGKSTHPYDRNEEINLFFFSLVSFFPICLPRIWKNIAQIISLTSVCHSFAFKMTTTTSAATAVTTTSTLHKVLIELTMLFTFSSIFHNNPSTYSLSANCSRSRAPFRTFIERDTCAHTYDTRSVQCVSVRTYVWAVCMCAQTIRFVVRCCMQRSSLVFNR